MHLNTRNYTNKLGQDIYATPILTSEQNTNEKCKRCSKYISLPLLDKHSSIYLIPPSYKLNSSSNAIIKIKKQEYSIDSQNSLALCSNCFHTEVLAQSWQRNEAE